MQDRHQKATIGFIGVISVLNITVVGPYISQIGLRLKRLNCNLDYLIHHWPIRKVGSGKMAKQIIRQPNGLYAQWSSIVDDFVMVDATPQDIIDDWMDEEKSRIAKHINEVIDSLENGGRPYHQFTKTFEEAVEEIRERHGNNAESLKMLGVTK